jgi:hypothetical protein
MIIHFFLRMLVGHLLGDFVFQPLWLAVEKRKGWPGLLLHTAVVTITTGIMIWGVIPQWLLWTAVLFAVHLFIDQFRTFVFTDNQKGKGVILFILDQIVHLISIIIISWLATGEELIKLREIFNHTLPTANAILLLISLIIVIGWVIPILEIELTVAIMSYREPTNTVLAPIGLSDRILGSLERLASLILIAVGFTPVIPLVFLPRLAWLLTRNRPVNKIATFSKMGTSLTTTILMGFLLWSTNLPASF